MARRKSCATTRYLISFPGGGMVFADENLQAGTSAVHAVMQEAKDAGVWVFGGGIDESVPPVLVGVEDIVTAGTYRRRRRSKVATPFSSCLPSAVRASCRCDRRSSVEREADPARFRRDRPLCAGHTVALIAHVAAAAFSGRTRVLNRPQRTTAWARSSRGDAAKLSVATMRKIPHPQAG